MLLSTIPGSLFGVSFSLVAENVTGLSVSAFCSTSGEEIDVPLAGVTCQSSEPEWLRYQSSSRCGEDGWSSVPECIIAGPGVATYSGFCPVRDFTIFQEENNICRSSYLVRCQGVRAESEKHAAYWKIHLPEFHESTVVVGGSTVLSNLTHEACFSENVLPFAYDDNIMVNYRPADLSSAPWFMHLRQVGGSGWPSCIPVRGQCVTKRTARDDWSCLSNETLATPAELVATEEVPDTDMWSLSLEFPKHSDDSSAGHFMVISNPTAEALVTAECGGKTTQPESASLVAHCMGDLPIGVWLDAVGNCDADSGWTTKWDCWRIDPRLGCRPWCGAEGGFWETESSPGVLNGHIGLYCGEIWAFDTNPVVTVSVPKNSYAVLLMYGSATLRWDGDVICVSLDDSELIMTELENGTIAVKGSLYDSESPWTIAVGANNVTLPCGFCSTESNYTRGFIRDDSCQQTDSSVPTTVPTPTNNVNTESPNMAPERDPTEAPTSIPTDLLSNASTGSPKATPSPGPIVNTPSVTSFSTNTPSESPSSVPSRSLVGVSRNNESIATLLTLWQIALVIPFVVVTFI